MPTAGIATSQDASSWHLCIQIEAGRRVGTNISLENLASVARRAIEDVS